MAGSPARTSEMERVMIDFKQILCPVDFSDSSNRSLDHAVALAQWYDATLTVLHVAPTFEPMPVRSELGYPIQIVNPLTRDEVVAVMRNHLDVAGRPRDVIPTARDGDPSTTIIDEALTRKADLIVMGTHGRRGFKRLLLGSVTEAVLREAPCHVLTVASGAPDSKRGGAYKQILSQLDCSSDAH